MIYVVGLGPGAAEYRTPLADKIIAQADWIVGSTRQLNLVSHQHAKIHILDRDLADLVKWLRIYHQENVVVLASGDPMLYGIGKLISKELKDLGVSIISGISSVQYLLAKIGLDMNDIYLTSTHGKQPDFDFLLQHKKVAFMTDNNIGPVQIAQEVRNRGLQRMMVIGEKLSCADEKITVLPADCVPQRVYQMNVVVIYDER